MKTNTLAIRKPSLSTVVVASVLAMFALGWVLVAPADAGRKDKKRTVVIESSGEHEPFLGIVMQDLTPEVLKGLNTNVKRGVLVTQVMQDSPADKAGIQDGDIIIEFDNHKVDSADELRDQIGDKAVGDDVKIKLARGKDTETLEVALGDWADYPTMSWVRPGVVDEMLPHWRNYVGAFSQGRLGVEVSDINSDLGSYFGVKEGEGVLVLDVDDASTAESIGVKSGDVITEVQGESVESASDIRASLSDIDAGDEVHVTVVRNKKKVELKGEMQEGNYQAWQHGWGRRAPNPPSFVPEYDKELRKELDELRKEIQELKKELKEGLKKS